MFGLISLFIGCVENNNSDNKDTATVSEPISVSVQLLDAMGGNLPDNITLTSSIEEITIDASGTGSILVPGNAQFTIQVEAPDYVTHQLIAKSGEEDIRLVTLLAAEDISLQIYGMLDIEANEDRGTLVVALDHPDLSPATGASAEIDSEHDGAFVLGGFGPSLSNVVPSGAGFVSFANVEPGPTNISVTPADGEHCWFYDAGGDSATVSVTTGQATVAFFMCE